jgi:hypothetical protein
MIIINLTLLNLIIKPFQIIGLTETWQNETNEDQWIAMEKNTDPKSIANRLNYLKIENQW